MRSNRKRHEKNYIVVKCESKAYEKFQFAIRNGVCEPEVEIVGCYYYLFRRDWKEGENVHQMNLIMIIVKKLLQSKNREYRFVFSRRGESDDYCEIYSNCDDPLSFVRNDIGEMLVTNELRKNHNN